MWIYFYFCLVEQAGSEPHSLGLVFVSKKDEGMGSYEARSAELMSLRCAAIGIEYNSLRQYQPEDLVKT